MHFSSSTLSDECPGRSSAQTQTCTIEGERARLGPWLMHVHGAGHLHTLLTQQCADNKQSSLAFSLMMMRGVEVACGDMSRSPASSGLMTVPSYIPTDIHPDSLCPFLPSVPKSSLL